MEVEAPYVNEMVRTEIVRQFGDEAYARGLKVYTTVKDTLQIAANDALWNGLVRYDRRHGFRGVVRHVELHEDEPDISLLNNEDALNDILSEDHEYGRFKPALVLQIQQATVAEPAQPAADGAAAAEPLLPSEEAVILFKSGERAVLPWKGMSWARSYISLNRIGEAPTAAKEILKPGDVIWVSRTNDGSWELGQAPEVQGALVSLAPNDGSIQALTGGFNFQRSNFNRATQAKRQAGSGFKPIIYSAALSKSFTPASLINDAPVVFEDEALEAAWRPENYSGKFFGPIKSIRYSASSFFLRAAKARCEQCAEAKSKAINRAMPPKWSCC